MDVPPYHVVAGSHNHEDLYWHVCNFIFLEDQQLANYPTRLFILKLRNDGFAIADHVPSAMGYFNWTIPAWKESEFVKEEPPAARCSNTLSYPPSYISRSRCAIYLTISLPVKMYQKGLLTVSIV